MLCWCIFLCKTHGLSSVYFLKIKKQCTFKKCSRGAGLYACAQGQAEGSMQLPAFAEGLRISLSPSHRRLRDTSNVRRGGGWALLWASKGWRQYFHSAAPSCPSCLQPGLCPAPWPRRPSQPDRATQAAQTGKERPASFLLGEELRECRLKTHAPFAHFSAIFQCSHLGEPGHTWS